MTEICFWSKKVESAHFYREISHDAPGKILCRCPTHGYNRSDNANLLLLKSKTLRPSQFDLPSQEKSPTTLD